MRFLIAHHGPVVIRNRSRALVQGIPPSVDARVAEAKNLSLSEFAFVTARQVRSEPGSLPDDPGIYVLQLVRREPVLAAWGVEPAGSLAGPERSILYLGLTERMGVARRVQHHLVGDSRQSTFRRSLGVLLADKLRLLSVPTPRKRYFHYGPGEERLSGWISDHVTVGYKPLERGREEERELIREMAPALNIDIQRSRPMSRVLMALRERAIE